MSASSSPPSLTASDFYGALTVVWLFLTLVALEVLPSDASWRAYALPIGTLIMLGFYARAWRRSQVRSRSSAESIESADGQHYTVTLAGGWTFTDGTPVTARSFVDAWNYGALSTNAQLQSSFFDPIEGRAAQRPHPDRAPRGQHVHLPVVSCTWRPRIDSASSWASQVDLVVAVMVLLLVAMSWSVAVMTQFFFCLLILAVIALSTWAAAPSS